MSEISIIYPNAAGRYYHVKFAKIGDEITETVSGCLKHIYNKKKSQMNFCLNNYIFISDQLEFFHSVLYVMHFQ